MAESDKGLRMNALAVNATDGPAGTVKDFLRNSQGELTHLVIHDTQPWGGEDIAVPIEDVEHVGTDRVQLKLNRRGLALLPALLACVVPHS
jgi:hypothetical protein